jgi:hypothetical protein
MTAEWDDPQDADYVIMQSAREGDYTLLIEALRTGAWAVDPPWRRDLLIEMLEGGSRPRHRQAGTVKDLKRKAEIYRRVRELIDAGWPRTAADAKVAEEFGCNARTVNEIRRWKERGDTFGAIYLDEFLPRRK